MSWLITPQQKVKGLLDEFTGAAAAYSLRNLSVLRSAPVVRVRRSSDNTEQDFTETQVVDGTLVAFCGAGDGHVRTWYDQSVAGLHLTQTINSNQPQIVSSGVLNTEGGKPCIKHTTSTNATSVATSYSSSFHSVFKVCRVTAAGGPQRVLNVASEVAILRKEASGAYQMYGSGMSNITSGTFPVTRVLLTGIWLHSDGDMFSYANGNTIITNTVGSGATASVTGYAVGGVPTEGFVGNVQEVIIYRSNQSANRIAIEANINAHYAIY